MRRQIEQLDPVITEILAASEAVDRPVSVVKELFENAIDAGATQIDAIINAGGQNGISVRDNGHGMSKDDLERACLKHHSSKTRTTDDALRPRHIGLRGEALYAISRAADVTISSRTKESEHAHAIDIVNGDPSGAPYPERRSTGTRIRFGRLFQRIPARRAHLGSVRSDVARIKTYVQRVALQYPEISFSLCDGSGKPLLSAAKHKNKRQRYGDILGAEFTDNAIDVQTSFEAAGEQW